MAHGIDLKKNAHLPPPLQQPHTLAKHNRRRMYSPPQLTAKRDVNMAVATIVEAARQWTACVGIDRKKAAACRRNGTLAGNPRLTGSGGSAVCTRAAAVMALSLALLACAAASAPHIGKTARPDNRLPLSALPEGETTWKAKDLDIRYRAVQAGDNFEISGFIDFGSNLGKFPMVGYFRVYLHFLDAQGVVLETHLLWSPGINQEARFVRWTFERQWPLPPDAVAVGFSYQGGAAEAGGKSKFGSTKTGWEVYRSP